MAKKYTADSVEATSITGSLFGTASFATKTSGLDPLYQNVEIHGNLNVYGTSSFTYVTSSQIDVQESFISVNVFEPAERFGGLTVYDSGSSAATASLAWDSLHNHWVYQNTSGSTYSGGMLLAGPRNTGSLGDEPNLTKWMVARSDGGDHLDNTQIFSSGSVTQITGSLLVSNIPVGTTENQVVVRDGSGNLKYRTDLSLQGATGTQGTQGVAGYVGSDGAQGATGTQGTQGIQGVGGSIGGEGTQGTQGIQGTTGASIQGAQGYTGAQGTTGATGAQGIQGITGTQGATGTQGSTGAQGTTGAQGLTGFQGSTGNQGTTGAQGTTGTQGVQGIQGIQGPNAGITSYTNAADNRVLTSVSSTTINAEANLTFDGSTLAVAGTTTVTKLANTLTISPHASGVDIHSTGNFAPHYQTDFAWYTGAIGSGTNRATLNSSGDFTANSSHRAPVFYDSNNTGYYVDPASTSNLNAANFAGSVNLFGGYGPGSGPGLGFENQTSFIRLAFWGMDFYDWNHGIQMTIDNAYVSANNSFRAPVFYDNNDTSYYADFNSTADNAVRQRGGTLHGPNPTWGAYLLVGGDGRNNYINNTGVASICASNGNLHIDAASGYDTYLNFYDGGVVNFGNGANGIVSTINTDGSHRPQVVYDYNDTGYYIDPASSGTSMKVNGNIDIVSRSASWAEGLRIRTPGSSVWGGIRITRDRAADDGNWAIGFTGLNSSDDLTFYGTSNANGSSIRLNLTHGGTLTATGDIVAYSDRRVKENINPIQDALEKVKALRGVTYNRTDVEDKSQKVGVIAQEIQEVLPQVVFEQADGKLGVSYGNISAVLIEAIKEQQTQIENQQSQIDELKSLVKQLLG